MITQDPLDATAISLLATAAELTDIDEARALFSASDSQLRNHYRALAHRGPFVHADGHFRTGSGHADEGSPCQDFTTAGIAGGHPFAVVSDGCSSGGRTDLGARLLVMTAAKVIADSLEQEPVPRWSDWEGEMGASPLSDRQALLHQIIAKVHALRDLMDIHPSDMEATLGVVHALPGGRTRAVLFGDGVLAVRKLNGSMDIHVVDWAGNMPGYPWYARSPEARKVFVDQSEAFAREEGRAACLVAHHHRDVEGAVAIMDIQEHSAEDGLNGFQFTYELPANIDSLAVLTDGALQVTDCPWTEVVAALATFTSARAGAFAHRRMNRGLALLSRNGHRPVDDIAMAVIARAGG